MEMARFPSETALEFPPNGMSIDLLRAVYRNPSIPLPVRMRAAISCLPFELPKLAVTYQASETDFAVLLDERIKRHEARLNGGTNLIPHQPQPTVETKPMPTAERMRRRI